MADEQDVQAVTAEDVIQKRQLELAGEVFELDSLISEKRKELVALVQKREERMMEYEILEKFSERNMVKVTQTMTTTVEMHHTSNRMSQTDKVSFEDCLTKIMKDAGRPLQFGDIRNRVEKFGWSWNNYYSAHNYITRNGLLESAGKRGFYQLK